MARTRFKMPECAINPLTEKPYSRHKWTITDGKLDRGANGMIYYHVVCERPTCRLTSKNPVAF